MCDYSTFFLFFKNKSTYRERKEKHGQDKNKTNEKNMFHNIIEMYSIEHDVGMK